MGNQVENKKASPELLLKPSKPSPGIIVDLSVDKVSLCGMGKNSRAHILLSKGKEASNMPKTFDEVIAELTPEAVEAINKHIKTQLQAKDDAIAQLQKSQSTPPTTPNEESVTKAVPAAPANTVEEAIQKASPEVQQAFKSMRETLDALVAAQQEQLMNARYEAVKSIPVEEATLKEMLKSMSPATFEVLKKAAEAIDAHTLKEPAGSNADGIPVGKSADDYYGQLDAIAKELKKSEPSLTDAIAFDKACTMRPELYAKYVAAVKGGN